MLFSDVISKFKFKMPSSGQSSVQKDQDDDLIVPRKRNEFIEIGMFGDEGNVAMSNKFLLRQ